MVESYSNTLIFLFTPAVAKNSASRSKLTEHTRLKECKRSPCFRSALTFNLLKDRYFCKPSRKGFAQGIFPSLNCSFDATLLTQLLSVTTKDPLPLADTGVCSTTCTFPEEYDDFDLVEKYACSSFLKFFKNCGLLESLLSSFF
ncbi:hypothetical protein V8G54_022969 [Vigna mungo]|uniref:Uncharacterized protein n=1 Tax=Vigna mungo TaxID=3915 RepID=A0AAQ3RR43_VIGMU